MDFPNICTLLVCFVSLKVFNFDPFVYFDLNTKQFTFMVITCRNCSAHHLQSCMTVVLTGSDKKKEEVCISSNNSLLYLVYCKVMLDKMMLASHLPIMALCLHLVDEVAMVK